MTVWNIAVLRSEPGSTAAEDEYGNPVLDAEEVVQVFGALFAPSNSGEQVEPGRNAKITGGTIYKRGKAPDVQPDDHVILDYEVDADGVMVKGTRYAVDGMLGIWRNASGRVVGSQFAVKAATG